MANVWTKAQNDAIYSHGGSIIVSAAAGSGKTAVLVERVINLIVDEKMHVDADKLLVVTYTRAAAAELKDRLTKALQNQIKENPSKYKFLNKQSLLLQKANISTIHSFCSGLVREFFYELDIDRDFRIADDAELVVLKDDALNLTLEEMYSKNEADFQYLLDNFISDKSDKSLRETILKIYEFLSANPFPDKWIDEKINIYNVTNVDDTIWFEDIILPYVKEALDYIKRIYNKILECMKYVSTEEAFEKLSVVLNPLETLIYAMDDAISKKKWELIKNALYGISFSKYPSNKCVKEEEQSPYIKKYRDMIKKEILSLKGLFIRTSDECKTDIEYLSNISKTLFSCVQLFSKNYSLLKSNKRVADYSDLEHWMIKLLYNENYELSDLAYELRERYSEILVDEYQDANETQEAIFTALSGEYDNNLFVVGDMKQSIYSFRQAKPMIFKQRRSDSVLYDSTINEFPARIILDRNFRSSKVILDLVNFYFGKLMSESVGDIEYNNEEKLNYNENGSYDSNSSVELDVIDMDALDEEDKHIVEAKFIAMRIKEIMSNEKRQIVKDGIVVEENYKYSDFAILMRSESKYSPVYVQTLINHGIPAFSEKSYSFFSSPEIAIMTNLLRIIDNPTREIELLSVMMSSIYAFSSDEITEIKKGANRKKNLYKCVVSAAFNGNEKCKSFLDDINFFRDMCVTMPLGDFITLVYDRTNYMSIMTAVSDSNLPKANLRLLVSYARDYEINTHKGLSKFVTYIDRLIESEEDFSGGVDLDAGVENAVNVMSVHHSKGLEFPVVFLANTNTSFSSDSRDNVMLDNKYGFAIKRKDIDTGAKFNTMPRMAISNNKIREEMSEELRVLYVALTRPKSKLIMLSTIKSRSDDSDKNAVDEVIKKISDKISSLDTIDPYVVRSAKSSSEWIIMCALMHKNGDVLRNRYPEADICVDNNANFDFNINIIDDLNIEIVKNNKTDKTVLNDIDVVEQLNRVSGFEYKYKSILNLDSQVSVTGITHKNLDFDYDTTLCVPSFVEGSQMSGAERGTAFHDVLQFIDFGTARKDLNSELVRLKNEGYITNRQYEGVDVDKLKMFIDSDLITRCLNSKEINREYSFVTKIKPSMVDDSVDEEFNNEFITLAGTIDLMFLEDDQWIIVDYKADRTTNLSKLAEMYECQVQLYKIALEKTTKYKVKDCFIYSIHNSTPIIL